MEVELYDNGGKCIKTYHKNINDVSVTVDEGINVDANKNVTMTDKHENLVDTSGDKNPTVITDLIPNVKVWSVFKRKEGGIGDGNPLLHALKKEDKYKLTNEAKVKNRIEYIVKKFLAENSGVDVTIMAPSTNDLNKYFASVVAKGCLNPHYIDNIVVKMSKEEVANHIFEYGSAFRRYYGQNFTSAYKMFLNYCKQMKGESFRFHKIGDIKMRKTIEHTIKAVDECMGEYVAAINDKNVLIIDDSITLGNTISETCKIVADYFCPKSITVLTLFSPLYDKNGKELVNI